MKRSNRKQVGLPCLEVRLQEPPFSSIILRSNELVAANRGSGSRKRRALHRLRPAWGRRTSRQRLECAKLASAFEERELQRGKRGHLRKPVNAEEFQSIRDVCAERTG